MPEHYKYTLVITNSGSYISHVKSSIKSNFNNDKIVKRCAPALKYA